MSRSHPDLTLNVSETVLDGDTYMNLHTLYSSVSFRMTFSDVQWLSEIFMTPSIARPLCDSWASCIFAVLELWLIQLLNWDFMQFCFFFCVMMLRGCDRGASWLGPFVTMIYQMCRKDCVQFLIIYVVLCPASSKVRLLPAISCSS